MTEQIQILPRCLGSISRRSKSTLDNLKSVFNVFRRKLLLGALDPHLQSRTKVLGTVMQHSYFSVILGSLKKQYILFKIFLQFSTKNKWNSKFGETTRGNNKRHTCWYKENVIVTLITTWSQIVIFEFISLAWAGQSTNSIAWKCWLLWKKWILQ